MRYDHSTFSELDTPEPRCPHCKGRGFTLYERDNPMAAEPCGCDEPEDEGDSNISGCAT